MTWISPVFLVAGAFGAAAAVALHLITYRRPPTTPFPTARFIPPGTSRAVRRALRPDDLLLLVVRIAVLLLASAALAGPIVTSERRPSARIVVLDRSRALPGTHEWRDSLQALLARSDRLIVFDSVARTAFAVPESATALVPARTRANLTAGLIAAFQEAPTLREESDSIEIVVVSPFAAESFDQATLAVRATWPGRIRLVRVAGDTARRDGGRRGIEIRATREDPLSAAVALSGGGSTSAPTRIVRAEPSPDDSAWADEGRVLVHWPDHAGTLAAAGQVAADGFTPDSIGAVVAAGAVVVAAFERHPAAGFDVDEVSRPIAWWADGRVAAVERARGDGCIRRVEVNVPARGDLVLRPAFQKLLRALTRPCGDPADPAIASDSALNALAGDGALAEARALPAGDRRSPIAPWLLAGALLLALAEPLVRRRAALP